MPKNDALAKLRDIHLPDPIGVWPLAPGWYLLALVFFLVLVVIIFFIRRSYLNGSHRREALRLLKSLQKQYQDGCDNQQASAFISELLRRVALVYFPRAEVASLQGKPWIRFLNDTGKGLDFNLVEKELLEGPYKVDNNSDLQLLFKLTERWIKQRRGRCLS